MKAEPAKIDVKIVLFCFLSFGLCVFLVEQFDVRLEWNEQRS